MSYEVDIASGMVTLDGEPVGKVEDLLATLTKDEVNADELATCYAVAVQLRTAAVEYVQRELARRNDPVLWNAEDVERAATANLERHRFEAAVKRRTTELVNADANRVADEG